MYYAVKKRLLLQVGRSVIYSRGDDYLQALQPRLAKTHPKVIFAHLIHFCQIHGGTPMSLQKTLVMLLSASFYILISLDICMM
jgi:hypothetical protein